MSNIKNKTVLITGATSGIGRALTIKLFSSGANVAFCGKSSDKMKKLIKELSSVDGFKKRAFFDTFDISQHENIPTFVEKVVGKFGNIDILVNCAGINSAKGTLENIKVADLDLMLKVNLIAPFIFMQEVYNRSMLPQKRGLIINVHSTVCLFSNKNSGSYTASKTGFDAMAKVFRKEARENGIGVSAIYPGGVDTPFREIPNKSYMNAEVVADAIISMMAFTGNAALDEIVMRPVIEENYS